MEKIWKEVEKVNFSTCDELLKEFKKNNYKFSNNKFPIKLVRKYVRELGFDKPVELKMVYQKIEKLGYNLVPPEIAIYTRSLYKEQPTGEWLRFATPLNSMIDSDGVPHLPKLGKALGLYFVETYWSYPGAIFHPHNDFVMMVK
jgi:hypothetical protein